MARKPDDHDDFIHLSKDEEELIKHSQAGDWFFREGLQRYGEDWPAYVPDNINAFMGWYFKIMLLPKQLQAYYCPITDMMVHGGRYSAKTVGLAVGTAGWTVLHPGNNWLHVSPTLDQAALSYKTILEHGEGEGGFVDTFIRHHRAHPSPMIWFKQWDRFDPGSEAQFRSIGQNPMELLRSFEAGRITADEAFRTQTSDGPYRVLAGMARGPNTYAMNVKPKLKKEYDDLAFEVASETNPIKRKEMQIRMDGFAEEHGLSKDIRMLLYGNVGAYTWEWNRFTWGQRNPDKRWSVTWVSDDNPYCTEKQRDLLRQQHKDDPEGLRVEMNATRPIAVGDVFTGRHMQSFLDGDLDAEAIEACDPDAPLPGWAWEVHEDFGVYRYAKPKEFEGVYAGGADPGTGRVPHRNKWVNLVARIDQRPFEIVYVNTGNMTRTGQGSIQPWIADSQRILKLYNIPEGHYAVESGGTQKNVHEVVWYDNLRMVPLNMNARKAQLVTQAQLMLRNHLFAAPNIGLLEQEMLGYHLADKKLAQDFVMAFLALVFVIWPYVADEFELEEDDDRPEEEWWQSFDFKREVRDRRREVRVR